MKKGKMRKEIAISKSFLKAAKSDLNSAKILLKNKEYSNSLYHSQQAIEKILKALLALKRRFIFKHEVIAEFCSVFKGAASQEFLSLVEDKGFKIEQEGSGFRYPDFSGTEILDPTEVFTREDTLDGYKTAKEIVSMANKELRKNKSLLS